MSPDIGLEGGPEELEELAFRKINEGKVKDGLKLVLRAQGGVMRERVKFGTPRDCINTSGTFYLKRQTTLTRPGRLSSRPPTCTSTS